MRHGSSIALIAAVVSLAGLSARARGVPGQDPQTFRADARLVRVSVVVHDGRGRPVSGLTREDFQLLESGREQKVSLFLVEGGAARAAGGSSPGTFSNRIDGPGATGVTLILFDRLNTSYEHQMQARAHVIQYLEQIRPDDRIGFYVLDGDALRVLHGFTRDSASLLDALKRARARESSALAGSEASVASPPRTGDAAEDAELDAWLEQTELRVRGFFVQRRIDATIGALETVAKHLAGVRGRKNIIWISSSFPLRYHDGISMQNAGPDVMRATRALSDADISIYPVDARGLVGAFATPASARQQQFTTLDTVMRPVETSQVVAERTGGRAFFNTNDLGSAIRRAVEDTSLTYVLGYYPGDANWDGRFREIAVKLRRPGVNVRHRKGYFAIATPAPRPADRADAMVEALSGPLDSSAIGLTVGVTRASGAEGVTIAIKIDPDGITMQGEGDGWEGSVAIAIAQVLPDGRLFRSLNTAIPLRFDAAMRERLLVEGLTLTRTFAIRPDAHQIRVAVMDPSDGRIGTVTIPASHARAVRDGKR